MKLSYQGIQDKQGYAAAQVALPQYDWAKMAEKTAEKPVWVHFGAGNIFRGFIAGLQQRLLNAGWRNPASSRRKRSTMTLSTRFMCRMTA